MKTSLIFVLLLIAGCSTVPLKEPDKIHACFVVQWASPAEIPVLCGSPTSAACTINKQLIITRKPHDWQDFFALFALGHEVYHVLGAEHE